MELAGDIVAGRLRRVELTRGGSARLATATEGLRSAVARLAETSAPAELTAVERLLDELAAGLAALSGEPAAATTAQEDALDPVWRRWA